MEKILILLSVPIFLTIVLLLSVFVLAKYSGDEPVKEAPVKTHAHDTAESADNVAG